MSSFIIRVMILCNTACSASSVGAGTSTKTGSPSALRRYTPSSTRQRRWMVRLTADPKRRISVTAPLLTSAKHQAGRAANLIKVAIPKTQRDDSESVVQARPRQAAPGAAARKALPAAREPRDTEPHGTLTLYIQLAEVEQAFKELKHDLAVRPIFHRNEYRIEAHIFVAFLACCLQVTLKARLRTLAGGPTPRQALDKFKTMQMVDVLTPTTDGRELVLSRYTQPEAEHRMLLNPLRMTLPEQPPPKIIAKQVRKKTPETASVSWRPSPSSQVKSTTWQCCRPRVEKEGLRCSVASGRRRAGVWRVPWGTRPNEKSPVETGLRRSSKPVPRAAPPV